MEHKEIKIGKRGWFHIGPYKHGFHLGIVVDKYGFDLQLVFFYIGMEW